MSNNFDIVEALWLRREKKRREQKIIEGAPPLTYTAKKAGTLTDYRIYGNTVGGESVGDLVTSGEHAGEYKVPVTVEGKNLFDGIQPVTNNTTDTRDFLRVWFRAAKEDNPSESIALSGGVDLNSITTITRTFTMPSGYNRLYVKHNGAARDITLIDIILEIGKTYTISFKVDGYNPSIVDGIEITNIMLNSGSTALPYEPYHAPVTTPIYLPEQIKKVGDEAEYIDYAEQKQHFADGTSVDVTLPALPTIAGTNTLSVGTEVQPSKVMVRGKLKE